LSDVDEGRRERAPPALRSYRRKRDFSRTPEPAGAVAATPGARYAIQKHAARRLHYDLRLELDDVLKSWALTRGPSLVPGEKRLAMRTEDHPLDYADFEGVIPPGNYGAGTVLCWDSGHWEALGDAHADLARGHLRFTLHGKRLRGRWSLVRMGPARADKEAWLLIKAADAAARAPGKPAADVLTATTSVASGRTMTAIARGEPPARAATGRRRRHCPAFVAPALATLSDTLPAGTGWLYEIKFDGYRTLLAASGDEVHLYTRNGHDWTHRYGNVARDAVRHDFDGALIDGEIVVADSAGRSSYAALQRALAAPVAQFSFQAFDLLALAGRSLRRQPLVARKATLAALLANAASGASALQYSTHVDAVDDSALAALCAGGFEGLIAKRADAPYRSGRGRSWLKIKCRHDEEYVIGGYTPSVRDLPFASVLLGRYDATGLRYAGRAGTGLRGAERQAWLERFAPLRRAASPFIDDVPARIAAGAVWLEPRLAVQVHSAGLTGEGLVRHGVLQGLRDDKPAVHVRGEDTMSDTITIGGVRVTHAARPVYTEPSVCKQDVLDYLARVAPRMLPHVAGRLLSVLRCPAGADGKCFYQRHYMAAADPAIYRHRDGEDDYLHVDERRGILALAQLNALEFHPWGSRVGRLEQPDRLVFDLDPDEDLPFSTVRDAAAELRDVLQALKLESLPLLTGGKGVHVVVPIVRRYRWPVVKSFTKAVAERLAAQLPTRYVATMSKARRKGRIFVDYLRNERGATAIAPYSPRARADAPVAWPLSWRALRDADTAALMRIVDVSPRAFARRDPWADYDALRRPLRVAALRALDIAADDED
jgi:bifunctional non-homologous end joining protein LigD